MEDLPVADFKEGGLEEGDERLDDVFEEIGDRLEIFPLYDQPR